jgi:hypothetical protein
VLENFSQIMGVAHRLMRGLTACLYTAGVWKRAKEKFGRDEPDEVDAPAQSTQVAPNEGGVRALRQIA